MSLTWLFGPSRVPTDASAVTVPASINAAEAPGCPVDHSTRSKWLSQQKASGQPEAPHPFVSSASTPVASTSSSSSTKPLSSQRETSTIPRYLASSPNGPIEETAAEASTSKWVYPSPSQFFTALQRKDRKPRQEDMDTVVTIHNAVNERTWHEVMRWEKEAGEDDVRPQLVTFKGRPNDRSPRAWWKVLLGYQAPFDRHDWIVDRNGKRIRYVIDFYTGRGANAALPEGVPPQLAFYLDVRPALDDFEGVKMRIRHNINKLFGFASVDNSQGTKA